jgi:hypothetical protein
MEIATLRIVSGGQTGADRAALDWAIAHQIPHGGWAPAGRIAEDGTISARYELIEMPDGGGYRQRTKANVKDSDATLIVSLAPVLSGGSLATAKFGDQLRKPWLHVHPENNWQEKLADWVQRHVIQTLNVAGPRASKESGVSAFTIEVLDELLKVIAAYKGNTAAVDVEPFNLEIEAWIDDQRNPQEARWLARYAMAFNTLNISPLRDSLAQGVTYDSQSVFDTMTGRDRLLPYFEGKFRAIRSSKNRVAAELADLPGGQPCVAVYQASSDMDTNWLDTPLAAMTVRVTPEGQAKALLMITCAPSPSTAEGSGLFPGCDTPPTTRERRFIRSSPTFKGVTLYFYYLDGEIRLDKAMAETADHARRELAEIKVIEVIYSETDSSWQRRQVFEALRFNGFPSVGALFKGKPIYRHQGLISGTDLVEALQKAAPLYVASN